MASFSITNFPNNDTITEGSNLAFTLTRSSDLTSTATVRWDIIQDGRFAALNSDFSSTSGTFSFAANEATKNVSITINDDSFRGQDRSFSLRLTEVPSSGPEVQIGSDRAITLIEDDTSSSFRDFVLSTSSQHDTLVLGSSYTYTGAVTGGIGNDTLIITKYQNLDLTIADTLGINVLKFDEDVSITHVNVNETVVIQGVLTLVNSITLTLGTGADITVTTPAQTGTDGVYQFQLADGALTNYTDFVAAITAGGFENDSDGNATTELNTAYAITTPALAPNSGTSQFTVSSLPDTITEGTDLNLTFTLTPSSALTSATTVRWDIIQDGRSAALNSDFAATTGVVNFANGATAAQNVSITINDDSFRGQDRSFSLRLTEVATGGAETQIGSDHAITLIEDDTGSSFRDFVLSTSSQHDTLVLGSSYTYTGAVTGGIGNDTLIITKYQNLDLTIADTLGINVLKFDEDVSITHVNVNETVVIQGVLTLVNSITLTLGTGADITVTTPAQTGTDGVYQFQLGDGALTNYTDFHAEITSGGFDATETTQLRTEYAITNNKNAPTLIATTTGSTTATVSETFTAETPITGISFTPNDVETPSFAHTDFRLRGTGANLFEVVALTLVPGESQAFGLQLKSGAEFNFEATPSHAITVEVADGGGLTASIPVNITITNVNEAPKFQSSNPRGANVNENDSDATIGGIIFYPVDPDGDPFTLTLTSRETTGLTPPQVTALNNQINALFEVYAPARPLGAYSIRLKTSLDHEMKDSYALAVTVSDGTATSAPLALTIRVNDIDEAPTATDSGIATGDRTTYDFTANNFGFTDPEGDALTSIRIETLPTLGSLMLYNETTRVKESVAMGQTVLANAIGNLTYVPFDGNTNTTTSFTYLVTTYHLQSANSQSSAAAATLTITLNNEGAANAPPTLNSVTAAGSVAENVQGADISLIRFTPRDAETSSFMATDFTLRGTGADLFDVVSREGASFGVKLKSEASLDFEATRSYTINVTVEDDGFTSSTPVALTINVTDANDAPILNAVTGATIADSSNLFSDSRVKLGSLTGTLSGTDVDTAHTPASLTFAADNAAPDARGTFTHSVTGTYGKFYYTPSNGAYEFVRNEAKINAVGYGQTVNDTFAVRAVDPAGLMSEAKNIVFTVEGANDSPSLIIPASVGSVDENVMGANISLINFKGNDPDTSQTAFTVDDFSFTSNEDDNVFNNQQAGEFFEAYVIDAAQGTFGLKLKTGKSLNYETAPTDKNYNLSINVRDDFSGFGSTFLTVNVDNVNETDASVSIARTQGSGAVSIGDVYTANFTPDLDLPNRASYTYQWLRGDSVVTSGAKILPYTVTAADSNSSIKFRATYTDPADRAAGTKTVTSNAVMTPVYNSPPTGSLTVTPALSTLENIGEGLTLTENFTDADGINTATKSLVAYYSDQTHTNLASLNADTSKTSITLAGSGSRINLTKAMFEQQIYAVFSYTDNVGTAESVFENLGYFDAGDSAATATRLADVIDGNTLNGHLEASDTDYFSFVIAGAEQRIVTFTEIEVGRLTSGNLYLALVDSNGVAQTNSTEIRGITTLKTTLGAGTYYVRASGAEGDYSLTYTANKAAPFTIPSATETGNENGNTLTGGTGAETIQGGSGDDIITTGGGDDLVIGGYGRDTITLNSGAETILYRYESDANGNVTWKATDGGDTIKNFRRGTDKLYLIDTSDNDPHNDFAELSTDSANGRFTVTFGYGFGGGSGGLKITSVDIKFDIPGDSSAGDTLKIEFDTSGPLLASSGSVESHFTQREIGGVTTSVLNEFHYLDDLFGGTASFDVIDGDSLGDLIIL